MNRFHTDKCFPFKCTFLKLLNTKYQTLSENIEKCLLQVFDTFYGNQEGRLAAN